MPSPSTDRPPISLIRAPQLPSDTADFPNLIGLSTPSDTTPSPSPDRPLPTIRSHPRQATNSGHQFCQQYMRQEPYSYKLKSLYANKVEVNDYKLLCLARVEMRGEKFTLVGILGCWWILPLSSGLFPTLCSYANRLLIKEGNTTIVRN